ncbi:Glycosyltransferase [uncultured Thiomicrorhabdus sp.]
MSKPFFSVCVPNYNYGSYIAETIESALNQPSQDVEVVVADNASTDNSVEVVQALIAKHDNIKLKVNRCNVGFYENLKRAASMASGEWMTMLSSDDLATPDAYPTYKKIIDEFGEDAKRVVLCSNADKIDAKSKIIENPKMDMKLWKGAEINQALSDKVGADVWEIDAGLLLKNNLEILRNPLHFATTTYPKALHDEIEGYSWSGLINPDRQFAYNLLSVAYKVFYVDKPLFQYRWHDNNQTAQQAESGALKFWVDEYVSTFNLPNRVLEKAGVSREQLAINFVEQDIALRGLLALANGQRLQARRLVNFGKAAYPKLMRGNKKIFLLRILLVLGHIGTFIAKQAANKRLSSK